MVIMGKQKKAQLRLNQLKHRPYPHLLRKKQVVFHQRRKLELLDAETDCRIGQALAEHKAGLGIRIKTDEELAQFLTSLKHDLRDRISA